ncbi:AAEL003681-PA [Aedes aegypti]|uniref:AAEL003681-PA n=1 Tax=Aedes aegypti TaxID=7159 RepID=Q17ET8_AEDAE|nr:AAEL003681-PA [Aedes aegypti]
MAPTRKRSGTPKTQPARARKDVKKPATQKSKPDRDQQNSRKAAQIHKELSDLAPEQSFGLKLNEGGKPRRGAFEISVAKSKDAKPTQIWTGLSKGPPRKDKFPEANQILKEVLAALK